MEIRATNCRDIQVGEIVTRNLAETFMQLKVSKVSECFIETAGGWVFERDTGWEYDPMLEWGSAFGATGSYIVREDRTAI